MMLVSYLETDIQMEEDVVYVERYQSFLDEVKGRRKEWMSEVKE
jgi:hypothetical protein